MRIVLVNQYAGGPSLGMEFRPHWMAAHWQRRGHDVLVVCGDRSHLRNQSWIPPGMADRDGVNYLSLRTTPYTVNGSARFLNLMSFAASLRTVGPRLRRFGPDVVIASSTHPFDVRPAQGLARAAGAKFVFEVHDLWPLTPILLGGMSQNHPAIRMMRRSEAFAYAHADLVVSLLPATEAYMSSRGLAPGRWIWIPNGVDDRGPSPAQAPSKQLKAVREGVNALRARYPLILMYAGGHGLSNDLERLLRESGFAADRGMALALIGDGPLKEHLESRFGGQPNVEFFEPVPRGDVVQALRLADFAYAGAAPSPLYSFGISFNKIYDYMSAGVPVIENIGAGNSPVADAGSGLVADPRTPETLRSAIACAAASTRTQQRQWGENGARFVAEHMRQSVLADRMLQAIRGVEPGARR